MAPPRCLVAKMSRCKLKYALPLYVSSASLTYLAPVKFPDQVAARTQQPGQAVGPELPDGRRTEIRSATRGETAGVSRSPTAPAPTRTRPGGTVSGTHREGCQRTPHTGRPWGCPDAVLFPRPGHPAAGLTRPGL